MHASYYEIISLLNHNVPIIHYDKIKIFYSPATKKQQHIY